MTQPILEVRDVAKRFGDLQAVHPLSFDVRPGEIFGFLGPNGAGKTTTLRMLMGITRPDSGAVTFDGKPGVDPMRAGYLPEERGLFEDMPVLDTLGYLGELRGMTAGDARREGAALLGTLGLGERVRDKVSALSKGNQQKVQLAGAILHRPALAVLDEPFSGLDPLNQELLIGLLRELRTSGTAVLLSAHHLDLVERLADRFLLISRGRDVLHGTLDEIRREAAAGVEELVTVRLAARDGAAPEAATLVEAAAGAGFAGAVATPETGGVALEAPLRHGADLAPLVASLGRHAAVRSVETRRLRLHEIYVRAVGGDASGFEAEEVRS